MKSVSRLMLGLLAAGWAIASTPALASSADAPKTRAQVRAELIEWRAAGFDPLDWMSFPENAQRAAAIVAQRRAARAQGATQLPVAQP